MSSHEEAPPIKLCSNKKEQEKYENLAGEQVYLRGCMWKLVYYSIAAVLSSVMAVPLQRLSSERYIMRSWDRPYSSPMCDNKESMC